MTLREFVSRMKDILGELPPLELLDYTKRPKAAIRDVYIDSAGQVRTWPS